MAPTRTAVPPAPASSTPVATLTPAPAAVTLDAKIGQMLIVGFRGLALDSDNVVYDDIASGRLGNVVLFDTDLPSGQPNRNIDSPTQLTSLDQQLQALAPVRMLIAADQEGGLVARLKPEYGFPATVSPRDLGEMNDAAATRRYAATMAAALAGAGVDLNLAPVVDVNVNPDNPIIGALGRSFSADPGVVAEQAMAFVDGHHDEGILCTLKHFPGHGSSTQDSHLGFVDVTGTWSRRELIPYQRIIDAGKADVIMTAHIFNATLDDSYPATLSRKTITGLLREELRYDGVVITDDMQMAAIRDFYGFTNAIELAVNAGADMISIANNTVYESSVAHDAFVAIKQAVLEGRISESRIDESCARISRLKSRLAAASAR